MKIKQLLDVPLQKKIQVFFAWALRRIMWLPNFPLRKGTSKLGAYLILFYKKNFNFFPWALMKIGWSFHFSLPKEEIPFKSQEKILPFSTTKIHEVFSEMG
jgi:hypothetical protein